MLQVEEARGEARQIRDFLFRARCSYLLHYFVLGAAMLDSKVAVFALGRETGLTA